MTEIRRLMDAAMVMMLARRLARRLMGGLRTPAMGFDLATIGDRARAIRLDVIPRPSPGSVLVAAGVAAIAGMSAIAIARVVRSRRQARLAGSSEPAVELVAVPVSVPTQQAETVEDLAPSDDRLRRIRGIGPETSKRLRSIGVVSTEQIADWDPDDVQQIGQELGLDAERIVREDWVGQAKALSEVPVAFE